MATSALTPFRQGSLMGGDPFLSLHREVNRLFDDAFHGTMPGMSWEGGREATSFINASMNVSETDKDVRVTAELPGVAEKDIDIDLDDDMLTIRGEKRFEKKDEKENFHFMERSFGSFQRSIRLPYKAAPDQVQARFENGVLTVTIPKTAGQQQRPHRIKIQGASQQSQLEHGQSADTSENQPAGSKAH